MIINSKIVPCARLQNGVFFFFEILKCLLWHLSFGFRTPKTKTLVKPSTVHNIKLNIYDVRATLSGARSHLIKKYIPVQFRGG